MAKQAAGPRPPPLSDIVPGPWQPRMAGLDDALYLDDPGPRIRLIAKVRDQSALSIGLHHLDTDALVLLRDQSEDRLSHECCIGWRIAARHQPQRVLSAGVPLRQAVVPQSADNVPDGMNGSLGSRMVISSVVSSSLMVVLELPAAMAHGPPSCAERTSHGDFTCGRRMVLPPTRVRYRGVPNEIDPDCSLCQPAGRLRQLGNRCKHLPSPWRTRRLPRPPSDRAVAAQRVVLHGRAMWAPNDLVWIRLQK